MTVSQWVWFLIGLSLLKSAVLAATIAPTYGADGVGYLKYVEVAQQAHPDPEEMWEFRGSTPVYPLFAYTAYLFGLGSGYSIVLIQVLLGATVAPSLYIVLHKLNPKIASVAGLLVALDPQTGLLYQQVATEGLYITLIGWGLAAFIWQIQQKNLAWGWGVGLGLLLGLGSLTRPIGLFLLVPYAVFYLLATRAIFRTLGLVLGYGLVMVLLSTFNLWRFDYFATHNTSGFYLATRLFGVGELYDHNNGVASERLYYLAGTCYLQLTESGDSQSLNISRYLRQCLYYRHGMSFDEISSLYQAVYLESTQANPFAFIETMFQQAIVFLWQTSDPLDLAGAEALKATCEGSSEEEWYSQTEMFCPVSPEPLAFLQKPLFLGILAFSLLTRGIYFLLAAFFLKSLTPALRWLWLITLGLYSYHLVVTAAAGTILSRYITVTNLYVLIALAIWGVMVYERWANPPKISNI